MSIAGKIVYLRAMEQEDMACYWDMVNDPNISRNVVGWSFPVSKQEQSIWYDQEIKDKRNIRFTIAMQDTGEAVGMVALTEIDWHNRRADLGIKLHPKCPKRKGIATDAVMTLMGYAFEEVNLNRLDACQIIYNTPSRKLYEKCGWREEGIKRQAIYRNGEYHDLVLSGILKAEYYEAKERLGYCMPSFV